MQRLKPQADFQYDILLNSVKKEVCTELCETSNSIQQQIMQIMFYNVNYRLDINYLKEPFFALFSLESAVTNLKHLNAPKYLLWMQVSI